jgi:hypothetical protein
MHTASAAIHFEAKPAAIVFSSIFFVDNTTLANIPMPINETVAATAIEAKAEISIIDDSLYITLFPSFSSSQHYREGANPAKTSRQCLPWVGWAKRNSGEQRTRKNCYNKIPKKIKSIRSLRECSLKKWDRAFRTSAD